MTPNKREQPRIRNLQNAADAPSRIEAVTFDVGGTLIEPWPSVGHVYSHAAADHGHPGISPDELNRQFARAWRELVNFNHTRKQWQELVDVAFSGLVPSPLGDAFFADLYDRFAQPMAWRVFDDARPTLQELASRGVRLGVISNWDERLRPLLHKLKLDAYFEVILVSSEVGVAKPAKQIFDRAAQELSLAPDQVLHVGDSQPMDFSGARAAGLRALLLNRSSQPAERNHINSLAEVVAILRSESY